MSNKAASALLIIDVQRDFCSGGALEVPNGTRVAPVLNRVVEELSPDRGLIYASRDWHPPVTTHFQKYGGTWPIHCVAGTEGARLHPDLRLPPDAIIVTKGEAPSSHGYSAFEGHTPTAETLLEDLRRHAVTHLYVGGLATDYCVRHSVLDALKAGLRVTILTDAVAGVDVQSGDSARAIQEMTEAGAELTTSDVGFDPSRPEGLGSSSMLPVSPAKRSSG